MKNGTLVVADYVSGLLDEVTAELVTAATVLGGPVVLGLAAPDPAAVGNTNFAGVDRVVGIRLPADQPGHEVQQKAVEALIDLTNPRVVLLPLNWDTAAYASGLAEKNNLAFANDLVDLASDEDGAITATRLMFGGKVRASLSLPADCQAMLLLRPGVWQPAPAINESPILEITDIKVVGESRIRQLRLIEADTRDNELTVAEVIFGLGRGVGKQEHIAVFDDIARELGVSLGASRPLVDIGLLPRSKQIGQSGVTVKPRLYVAFGISGSVQHLAGMSDSDTIFAINTDRQAPIFDAAHFGAHIDAMEVARHLKSDD